MDQNFIKNKIEKNDSDFVYDKREDFNAEESNDWDEEIDDDF